MGRVRFPLSCGTTGRPSSGSSCAAGKGVHPDPGNLMNYHIGYIGKEDVKITLAI
jgi:hypothetical protein